MEELARTVDAAWQAEPGLSSTRFLQQQSAEEQYALLERLVTERLSKLRLADLAHQVLLSPDLLQHVFSQDRCSILVMRRQHRHSQVCRQWRSAATDVHFKAMVAVMSAKDCGCRSVRERCSCEVSAPLLKQSLPVALQQAFDAAILQSDMPAGRRALLRAGALPELMAVLTVDNLAIDDHATLFSQKLAARVLCNLTEGTPEGRDALLNAGVVPDMLHSMRKPSVDALPVHVGAQLAGPQQLPLQHAERRAAMRRRNMVLFQELSILCATTLRNLGSAAPGACQRRVQIVAAGAVHKLVEMMREGAFHIVEAAADALRVLSIGATQATLDAFTSCGAVEVLTSKVTWDHAAQPTSHHTVGVLRNLAVNGAFKRSIVEAGAPHATRSRLCAPFFAVSVACTFGPRLCAGAVPKLVKVLANELGVQTNAAQTNAAATLWNLAVDPASREGIRSAGAVIALALLLRDEHSGWTNAIGALRCTLGIELADISVEGFKARCQASSFGRDPSQQRIDRLGAALFREAPELMVDEPRWWMSQAALQELGLTISQNPKHDVD